MTITIEHRSEDLKFTMISFQVPLKGDFIKLNNKEYLVKKVTWVGAIDPVILDIHNTVNMFVYIEIDNV